MQLGTPNESPNVKKQLDTKRTEVQVMSPLSSIHFMGCFNFWWVASSEGAKFIIFDDKIKN